MFRNLINPDNGLMITMNQITDCIFLSLFWLLGCMPVFTAGASCAALYDSVYRRFRLGEQRSWSRFFSSFTRDLKASLLPNVLFVAALWFGIKGLIALWNNAVYGQISWPLFSALTFLAVTVLGVLSVLFPLLSRFDNSLPLLLKNTVLLGLSNLPRTIALGGDLDGCDSLPEGFSGVESYPKLITALRNRGVDDQTISDLCWNNAWRVMEDALRHNIK